MGFEFLGIFANILLISLFFYIITGPSSKHERTGDHVPPDPTPDRCHLTEQIHAAARDAGLCVDCGETREKCGGFMPDVLPGTPRAPRWVCGVDRPRFKTALGNDGAAYRLIMKLNDQGFGLRDTKTPGETDCRHWQKSLLKEK